LSLNYLSLINSSEGAAALRELLYLYGRPAAARGNEIVAINLEQQIAGVNRVGTSTTVRAIPSPDGPPAFVRGLEILVDMDRSTLEESDAVLLGAVLDQFFSKYVSINSFTQTVIRMAENKDEVMRWPARIGQRQNI
jgi:type VI secretion system protein ImpG